MSKSNKPSHTLTWEHDTGMCLLGCCASLLNTGVKQKLFNSALMSIISHTHTVFYFEEQTNIKVKEQSFTFWLDQ